MNVSAAKEKILKKIRRALSESTPLPFPESEGQQSVFLPSEVDMEVQFAEEFTHLLGKFVFCLDHAELTRQLSSLISSKEWKKIYAEPAITGMLAQQGVNLNPTAPLEEAEVALTSCECLVARTGSIVLSSAQELGRTSSVYAPVHVCIAYSSQLVYDVKDALQLVKDNHEENFPSLVTFATGPSRTADIEKTLVVGVHGPKEVYVFLVDQPANA